MLQPKSYPEMIGKALVFEAEPFVTMVDDDNPWTEGLFLTVCIGAAVGLAQLIGGLLTSASLPPAAALEETLVRGWAELQPLLGIGAGISDELVRQNWQSIAPYVGYSGWWRLLSLFIFPLLLTLHWLLYGLVTHTVARWLGGEGTLNETLGATALVSAPFVLLLLTIVPFASPSWLLMLAWGLLIAYRAVEVAHELPWRRSALVAVVPLLVALVLGASGLTFSLIVTLLA